MATRGGGQPASAPGWSEADVTPGDKSVPTATAQLRPFTAAAHSASGTAGNDVANDSVTCEGEQFRSATFIAALPVEVALRLVEGAELSDRGGAFGSTDVDDEAHSPTRRFTLAAVGDRRIFVSVERGGTGYGQELWTFERDDRLHWRGQMTGDGLPRPPASMRDLLHRICASA